MTDLRKLRYEQIIVSDQVLTEKIDFSILKLPYQINVIPNSPLRAIIFKLKDGIFSANLQTILPTCLIVT